MTLDCTMCGACCLGTTRAYVGCTSADVARMPASFAARVVVTPTYRALTMVPSDRGLRCSALLGVPGRRVACAIYEARPRTCRAVEPGDVECQRAQARVERGQ